MAGMQDAINDLLRSLQLHSPSGGIDLSRLSAVPYINLAPGGGMSVYDDANLVPALNRALVTDVANTPDGVTPALRDNIAMVFVEHLGGKSATQMTDAVLLNAYYKAGSVSFVALASARSFSSGAGHLTVAQRQAAMNVLDQVQQALQAFLDGVAAAQSLDPSVNDDLAQLLTLISAADNTFAAESGVLQLMQQTDDPALRFLVEPDAGRVALAIAFAPWLRMAMLSLFASSQAVPYKLRAYARFALTQAGAITLARLANEYAADGDAHAQEARAALGAIRTTLLSTFNGELSVDDMDVTRDITDLLQAASTAKERSAVVARASQELQKRLALTNNLQTTFDSDAQDVSRARWAFVMWLVALVAVIAVACFLIAANRLPHFYLLAVPTLAIVLLDLGGRALWRWARSERNGYGATR